MDSENDSLWPKQPMRSTIYRGNIHLYHARIQATAAVFHRNTTSSKKQQLSKNSTDAYRIHPVLKHFMICHTYMGGMKLTPVTDPCLRLHVFILTHVFIFFHQRPVKNKCFLLTQFSNTSFQDLLLIVQEHCSVIFVTVSGSFIARHLSKLYDRSFDCVQ